jgi:iron complex outermembrane receptor protein
MGSIRFDYFNNKGSVNYSTDVKSGDFNQSTFSPKLGLVYQIVENQLSIFTNYLNGFKNTAPRTQDDGTSKTFKPEQANQWEVGLKTDLFGKGLSAAISYYDIKVSNVVREDPSRKNFYVQDGENYSKGFELSLTASPIKGLNMIAGYSFNDSKITQTDNADYLDRRPESAGPKNMLNAWISYRINSGVLKGFGIGLGGNYYSENEILNRASTGVFTLPAYTIFNGSIYYDNDSFRVTIKMNNITNKEYYKGWSTINPQMPRNLLTSISFRF